MTQPILTTEYPVELDSFAELPAEKRPTYIFRRASNAEYLADRHVIYTQCEQLETKDEIIEALSARVSARLLRVYRNYDHKKETGTDAPDLMDFAGTLDFTQLVELATIMHEMEEMGLTDRKKFNALFGFNLEDSVIPDAENAKEDPAADRTSSKSTAPDAADTAAKRATTADTMT